MIIPTELRLAEPPRHEIRDASPTPEVSISEVVIAFGGFEQYLIRPGRPWRSLFASVLLHAAMLVCGFVAVQAIDEPASPRLRYRVTFQPLMTRLEIPRVTPPRPEVRNRNPAPGTPPAPTRGTAPGGDPDEGGRPRALREFQLPDVPRRPVDQTVLQPDSPPELLPRQVPQLPQFMFWRHAANVPRYRKNFVMPGRRAAAVEQPQLVAPPKLQLPPSAPADMGAAFASSQQAAKLTLPAAAAPPVRMFRPPPPRATPSAEVHMSEGEAAAILALNADPQPLSARVFEISPGNQIGRLPPPGFQSANGPRLLSGATGDSAGRAGGDSASAAPGTGTAGASAGPAGQLASSIPSPARRTETGAPAGTPLLTGPVPIRQVHPENGQFDIIVAQPSAGPGQHDRLLSGDPVYTVYLSVGTGREWILRYCAPNSVKTVQSENVVVLDNPTPIRAPYPRVTVVPAISQATAEAVLHGFLTAQGMFRALQAVNKADTLLLSRMEPYLAQWEFRPATRDGQPIELEIILVVPPLSR